MQKRWLGIIGLFVLAVSLLRPGAFDMAAHTNSLAQFGPTNSADRGIVTFAFGDWGGLTTETLRQSATPTHLVNAALALQATNGDVVAAQTLDLAPVYQQFGLATPRTIANWPGTMPTPILDGPLGLNTGTASQYWPPSAVTITNLSCAACHASVVFDATGRPDPTKIWLGGTNTSINLEAYTSALFDAVLTYGATDALLDVAYARAPDMSQRERMTLEYVVRPALVAEFDRRNAEYGRILPFPVSLAGATNGLASLRQQFGMTPASHQVFASIPDLGGRLWRNSFLSFGGYVIPGKDPTAPVTEVTQGHAQALAPMIAFFTVASMGIDPTEAISSIMPAQDVTAWMQEYLPQPFPTAIDPTLARDGSAIYATRCASCHGTYDDSTPPQLVAFPNWFGDVGTDTAQIDLVTEDLVSAVGNGPFAPHIVARGATDYAAPPLTGLWSSAPYLHNGSVPTLWHLMRPALRPAQFETGGHMVDLDKVGIALNPPADYVPWSQPALIDTTAFGMSNAGHTVGFEALTIQDMDALLEYLKTL